MYNVPDSNLEEPMQEKCLDCGYPLTEDAKGLVCQHCKEWREGQLQNMMTRSDYEEHQAADIIEQISYRYPNAEIELTMQSGQKFIKQ